MKTLVISAIIAMTSLVNVVSAAAVNRTDNFAYNTETNDGRVETQTVFKVENQKFLHHHLKYNYIYDNSGLVLQKNGKLFCYHRFIYYLTIYDLPCTIWRFTICGCR